MEWIHHLLLVAGGFIVGGGATSYVRGRLGRRMPPRLALGVIVLGLAVLATLLLPSTRWAGAVGVVLSLTALALLMSAARPAERPPAA